VPMAAAGAAAGDESVGWKPSAASALASLVKDEMEALSKPPPKPAPAAPVEESPLRGGGLLDLPAEEKPLAPTTNAATVAPMPAEVRHEAPPQRPAPPPPNPYLANPGATYSAPAVTQYRPPGNKNLMIAGIAGGAVLLLVVVVLLSYLAFRTPPQAVVVAPPPVQPPVAVVQPPPVVAQPAPVVAQPPPAQPVAQPTPIPTPAPTEVAAAQAPPAQPAATPTPAPAQPPPAQVAVAAPSQPKPVAQPKASPQPKPVATVARAEPEPEPKKAPAPSGGGDDDFDRAFGGSSSKPAPREEPKSEKKPAGYIPPAPGAAAGDVKESLGQADIMEVVLANKAALGKCVEEQKKKDPGTSGKLVMKWTIQTSGKTSNVGVVSEEFKGTYIATCIGGLVKGWQFPRHKKQGEPVQFPFKF
jgi:hypothetical protein